MIEQTAFDRDLGIVAGRQTNPHGLSIDCDELNASEFALRKIPNDVGDAQSCEHRPARWVQTIAANFFAWKFFTFEQQGAEPSLSAESGTGRSSRPASDDRYVIHWIII